jgi:hypothetical protein
MYINYLFIYSFANVGHLLIFVLFYYLCIRRIGKNYYATAVIHQHEFKHWFLKYKLFFYYIINILVGYSFLILNFFWFSLKKSTCLFYFFEVLPNEGPLVLLKSKIFLKRWFFFYQGNVLWYSLNKQVQIVLIIFWYNQGVSLKSKKKLNF